MVEELVKSKVGRYKSQPTILYCSQNWALESQVGRRTQTSRLRATHSTDQASAPAWTGVGAGFKRRRGWDRPAAARGAEAVLGAGLSTEFGGSARGRWPSSQRPPAPCARVHVGAYSTLPRPATGMAVEAKQSVFCRDGFLAATRNSGLLLIIIWGPFSISLSVDICEPFLLP